MVIPRYLIAILLGITLFPLDILAQPPGGDRGGRPSFGGDRGSGGFPGGGGDRGSGGFPGGGGSRGGPPGSGDRGGPPNGGSRGGPPGGGDRGGGFDPSAMLSRLDANGNGSIDANEMQGPAKFMLDRMASSNPEIAQAMSASKPIPISKITKAMEKMRGSSGDSSNSSSSSNSRPSSSAPTEPEPLVPGFGTKQEIVSMLGFGTAGSLASSIKIEERDLKEAADRMSRYDTNKDGIMDEKEIAQGRWSDNPMQFDRNGDKKLNVQELAGRYAKRRQVEELEKANKKASSDRRNDSRRREGGDKEEAPLNPWSNQASYKFAPRYGTGAKIQGLPEWFSSSDVNKDGQVMMNEFSSNWDESTIQEFARFDANGDGTITTLETLGAVKKGVLRGSSAPSSGSVSVSSSSAASSTPAADMDRSDLPADAEERWVQFSALSVKKADKDQNGRLTPDEWPASSGDFNSVDKNGDGAISLGEYYLFKKKK